MIERTFLFLSAVFAVIGILAAIIEGDWRLIFSGLSIALPLAMLAPAAGKHFR